MPHQSKQTPARRSVPQQFDLFVRELQMRSGSMPTWSGLTPETQAALTKLMTWLILDYADRNQTGSTTEGCHDL